MASDPLRECDACGTNVPESDLEYIPLGTRSGQSAELNLCGLCERKLRERRQGNIEVANQVLSSEEARARAVAGLVLGTSWQDTTDGRELNISRAHIESEAGDEFISLRHDYGSQWAEDFYTQIRVGNYTPKSPNADHVYAFVKGLEDVE